MKKGFRKTYVFTFGFVMVFALLVCLVLLASVPPVSKDALTHHLIVPKLFLMHGGIFEIPYIEFSYYPMNLQLLYMLPLSWGNDIIPKYIHMSFAVFTAVLIFNYLKDKTDKNWAIVGALFFLTIPIIIKLSITAYVDLGLIFFSTASMLQVLKWQETGFKLYRLVLAACFCGLALGCKYNGLVSFLILSLLVFFIYSRSHPSSYKYQLRALLYGGLFITVSIIVFGPWLIKNFIWTGNPLYPLYGGLLTFKQGLVDANQYVSSTATAQAGWSQFAIRKVVFGEKWWETLLIPIRIFFQGQDDTPKYFDGILNPFLCILPVFAFIGNRKQSNKGLSDRLLLFIFSALVILIVFLKQDMRIRWIAPAIPFLICLSVFGMKKIYEYPDNIKWRRFCAVPLLCIVFSFNLYYLANQFKVVAPFDYLSGKASRMEYISRYRPEIHTIEYANQTLKNDCRILALFLGNRRYYSNHQMMFDYGIFESIVKKSKHREEVSDQLKNKGFSHIIINYSLFNDWAETRFSDSEKKLIQTFFDGNSIMYAKDGFGLYKTDVGK